MEVSECLKFFKDGHHVSRLLTMKRSFLNESLRLYAVSISLHTLHTFLLTFSEIFSYEFKGKMDTQIHVCAPLGASLSLNHLLYFSLAFGIVQFFLPIPF